MTQPNPDWLLASALVAWSLVVVPAAGAQDLASAALKLIENKTTAEFGCLVNGADSYRERQEVNALVWYNTQEEGWSAVVANTNVQTPERAEPVQPCWADPGRCAVYIGSLPSFNCSVGRGIDVAKNTKRLRVIINPEEYKAEVLNGAQELMDLARGLERQDELVTKLPNAYVYMSAGSDGRIRARFVTPKGTVHVASMRSAPAALNPDALWKWTQDLATNDLATAGPRGAVNRSGLVIYGNQCFRLIEPGDLLFRLKAAEGVLPLSSIPKSVEDAKVARDDFLHSLIGSDFSYGPDKKFDIEQDPRIFISKNGKETRCPG